MIDADPSDGFVSFEEWIKFLVEVRLDKYAEQKEEERMQKVIERALVLDAEDMFEEADEDWSGEFEFAEFQKAFRSNPRFLKKVALACDIEVSSLSGLSDEEIENLFAEFDIDRSGAISFEEFIKGLAKIRLVREKAKIEEEDEFGTYGMDDFGPEDTLLVALDDAEQIAYSAHEVFSNGKQLTCTQFIELFRTNPAFVRKIALAADLPAADLKSLEDNDLKAFFAELDQDLSGTMSFGEFIEGLKQLRHAREEQKAEGNPRRSTASCKTPTIKQSQLSRTHPLASRATWIWCSSKKPSWTQPWRCRSWRQLVYLRNGSNRLQRILWRGSLWKSTRIRGMGLSRSMNGSGSW